MSHSCGRSLRWRLVTRLVTLQGIILTLSVLLFWGALAWAGLGFDIDAEDATIDAVRQSIARDRQGGLALTSTRALEELQADTPDVWFLVSDRQGRTLAYGAVPDEFARIGRALDHISQARLGWSLGDPPRPSARLKRVDSPAGDVQIITGPPPRLPLRQTLRAALLVIATVILPALVPMALATLVATPLVVRRVLGGLGEVVAEAERIDVGVRGARLPVDNVPMEMRPLVTAVNDALGRLDEGYARHQRFLADAAHELRTPIAILHTRLESWPPSPAQARLREDVARLSTMADELLDLQRLTQHPAPAVPVDLVAMAAQVAADLAPLAIAAGYELAFEPDVPHLQAMGDARALARALTNLVQNAITHGGRAGTITIRVDRQGGIEVSDEGEGVPPADRERVFEPFYRVRPGGPGTGLGLNLVREIVTLHRGHVAASESATGGAMFRMSLPVIPDAVAHFPT